MTDITRNREAIEAINGILSNGGIAEVKFEHNKLTVVEIQRRLKHPKRESR